MLRIQIGNIGPHGLAVDERVEATALPLLKAVIEKDASLHVTRPVHARLNLRPAGETIMIDGTVATRASVTCQRCLKPFSLDIRAQVHVSAVPEAAATAQDRTDAEVELLADEIDVITHSGDIVDLRDEVAQQVIMALPFSPLCKKTCKGLCHRCGVNLNETTCRCDPEDAKSPFAVLKSLSFPDGPK